MATLLKLLRTQKHLTLPTPTDSSEYFTSIVRSITSQQISTAAARSIFARVKTTLGEITPESVLTAPHESLRAAGLSPQKISYITYNAEHWHTLPITNFATLDNEAVIAHLTSLHGIGRWTAEMFLIFTLARVDVFSRGDLGLMQSLYHYYHFYPHYTKKIDATIESWHPYSSIAALTLWAARDTKLALP